MTRIKKSDLSNRRKDFTTAVVVQRAVLLLKRSKVNAASEFMKNRHVPREVMLRVLSGRYRKP